MQEKETSQIDKHARIIQLIVFDLADEKFCVDIEEVREIIRAGNITSIPDSPDFIKGLANVRGDIIAAIDLKTRLFLPVKKAQEAKHVIITRQEKSPFGLIVDEVTEVLRIPETDIKEPPEVIAKIHKEFVKGVITLEDRLIIMLDLVKILSDQEFTRLSEIATKYSNQEDVKTGIENI